MTVQETSLVVTNPVAQQSSIKQRPSTKRSLKKRPTLVDVLTGRAKRNLNRQASSVYFRKFVNIFIF